MYLIDHVAELRFVNRFIYAIKRIYTHTYRFPQQQTRSTYLCFPDAHHSPGVVRCSSREYRHLSAVAGFSEGFSRLPSTTANGSVAAVKSDVWSDIGVKDPCSSLQDLRED